MKGFDDCNSDEEVVFDNMLRSARNQTEASFGRLKARWAILARKLDLKLEILPTVIYACFILRNYCGKNKLYIDGEEVKSQIKILKKNEKNSKNVPDPIFSFDCGEDMITRKTITQCIKDCS